MTENIISEGLRSNDLNDLVFPIFEVDTYRSKMGEDRDVCVVTFQVKERAPAKDLMEFVEKSFNFVLDSDVSAGENQDGDYYVFVELERSSKIVDQIKEMMYGIKKLTGINEWKFRYHKVNNIFDMTTETLKNKIPSNPGLYEEYLGKYRTEGVKRFFNKTLMDDLTLDGDIVTFHKPFNQKVQLRMIKEGDNKTIIEGIDDAIQIDDKATSETLWLTKVLGDYNITKIGDKFVFDNGNTAMLLQRI
jgi:hypothetical protein